MAFSNRVDHTFTSGGKRFVIGYYNCAGVTTGTIKTGLSVVEAFTLCPYHATAVIADQPAINDVIPAQDGNITIVTTSSQTGYYMAVGQ